MNDRGLQPTDIKKSLDCSHGVHNDSDKDKDNDEDEVTSRRPADDLSGEEEGAFCQTLFVVSNFLELRYTFLTLRIRRSKPPCPPSPLHRVPAACGHKIREVILLEFPSNPVTIDQWIDRQLVAAAATDAAAGRR